jgi:hypothetical protein
MPIFWVNVTTSRRQGQLREGRSGGSPSAKGRADGQKLQRRLSPRASQHLGAIGVRCSIRLLAAATTSTAMGKVERFCWWNSRLLSIVRNTSNSAAASPRSLPFLTPDQPLRWTVDTSCPTSSAARRRGISSSSRMRIGDECGPGLFENRHRQLSTDGWKIVKKYL